MRSGVEVMSFDEFRQRTSAQGVPLADVAFVCPRCGTIQSARSLIRAGAGTTLDEVERYLAFSCIGRFNGAGKYRGALVSVSGTGCNWTLGGLFRIHTHAVNFDGSGERPIFAIASPSDAVKLKSFHDSLGGDVPVSDGTSQ